jgi:hypothetical protein
LNDRGTHECLNWQQGARQRGLPALGKRVICDNAANAIELTTERIPIQANETRAG